MNRSESHKPVIGLVGGVGSGKSTVARELASLGCAVIDADRIGHEVLSEKPIREEIRAAFGDEVFDDDGAVVRGALAGRVFSDAVALARLNAITHPRIGALAQERIAAALARPDVPAVVVDAPLLIEAGWDRICTHKVFVASSADTRRHRTHRDRGWDEATWRSREKSQKELDTKAASCEYTIDNSSSLPHLTEQVRRLFELIVLPSDRH